MRTRFTMLAAALGLAALVVVLGAAQAAPQTKNYEATVDVADAETLTSEFATLTLTLRNSPESKQGLGSAKFDPPLGVTVTDVGDPSLGTWSTGLDENGEVTFLSTVALTKGESVSAEVDVTITSACTNATWTTRGKQSNDFSGNPGNDFALVEAASNRRPLGRFDVDPIETVVPAEPDDLHVPQIHVFNAAKPDETTTTARVEAFDICGAEYVDYGTSVGSVATFVAKPDTPARLAGVDLSITWTEGTNEGTATLRPSIVETGDFLVITDVTTNDTEISAESNEFDVVEKLCTSLDFLLGCEWPGKEGKIVVKGPAPPAGNPNKPPSLGIGFFSTTQSQDLGFACGGSESPLAGTLINMNPRDYPPPPAPQTITISITFAKSLVGNGPASSHAVCTMKDYGAWQQASACSSATPALTELPCFLERKKTTGGDLLLVLILKTEDPWGGMS